RLLQLTLTRSNLTGAAFTTIRNPVRLMLSVLASSEAIGSMLQEKYSTLTISVLGTLGARRRSQPTHSFRNSAQGLSRKPEGGCSPRNSRPTSNIPLRVDS